MILVTGAGGFIGNELLSCLKKEGMQVLPVFRSIEFACDKDRAALDLTSPEHITLLEKSIERPDTVVHLAGRVEIKLDKNREGGLPVPGPENIYEIYTSNVIGTANLLRYCLNSGVKHIVFASSQAVYGIPVSENITEKTPCNPLEHYALSKVCCEEMLRLAPAEKISVTILRFPGIYSDKRKKGTVFRFCKDALEKREIRVKSDISLPFDVLHISDVVSAFLCAIKNQPRGYSVFNISSGEPNSLNLLADRIAGIVSGCTVYYAGTPQPVIRLDPSKANLILGWQARSPETRLRHMLDVIPHDRCTL